MRLPFNLIIGVLLSYHWEDRPTKIYWIHDMLDINNEILLKQLRVFHRRFFLHTCSK